MRNYNDKILDILELYVNPDNYRYVEEVQDEIKQKYLVNPAFMRAFEGLLITN